MYHLESEFLTTLRKYYSGIKNVNDHFFQTLKKEGNICYDKKDYDNASIYYNHALCCAAKGSKNVGIIYANRSAVALELRLFPECLKNIQMAREHHYPDNSLPKLMQREERCRKMLATIGLDGYANLVELFHGPVETFMIDCLKIDHNKDGTPFVTTNRDLKTGDIIAVQKPFSGILMHNSSFRHCLNCLNDCFLELIPCDECSSVMFCSIKCKESASEIHQYECGIIDTLRPKFGLSYSMSINVCRAIFKALCLFNGSVDKLQEYLQATDEAPEELFTLDNICNNEKKFLKAVYSLDQSLNDTICGSKNVSEDGKYFLFFLSCYPKMKKILPTPEKIKFIIRLASKITRTAVLPRELENERNGGYCPLQTVMTYSCTPNVVSYITKDCKIEFIAQSPIKAGAKLTVGTDNYIDYSFEKVAHRERDKINYLVSFSDSEQ